MEVVDGQSGKSRDDNIVVGEIGVEGLAERKVCGIVVDGVVDGRVGRGDVLIRKTSNEFLNIANTLGTACGVAPGVIIIVKDVQGLFEICPFILGEKGT